MQAKTLHRTLGALLFTSALLASPAAWAKACQENTGGACQGHWQCDDGDTTKVCTDVIKTSGVECACQKPAKRVLPINRSIMQPVTPVRPQPMQKELPGRPHP